MFPDLREFFCQTVHKMFGNWRPVTNWEEAGQFEYRKEKCSRCGRLYAHLM